MTSESRTVAGSYPSALGEKVWVALPHLPVAEAVDVEGWAVLTDGSIAPIAARAEQPPRALISFVWARQLEALAELWVDRLPRLPLMPNRTTMNDVPVARFDSVTVVLGSVGLGNEVWGPYRISPDQIVVGLDLVPDLTAPGTSSELSYLVPGPRIDCRITWSESSFVEMEPIATVLLEPAEERPPE